MTTRWNNPYDPWNSYAAAGIELDPDACVSDLSREYNMQIVDTQPRYVHMALDLPINYSTASSSMQVHTHTDVMVTVRMPKSSFEALAVRHKRDHDMHRHRYQDGQLPRELYLRKNSAAVARAYEQYLLCLKLAWEGESEQ